MRPAARTTGRARSGRRPTGAGQAESVPAPSRLTSLDADLVDTPSRTVRRQERDVARITDREDRSGTRRQALLLQQRARVQRGEARDVREAPSLLLRDHRTHDQLPVGARLRADDDPAVLLSETRRDGDPIGALTGERVADPLNGHIAAARD